MRKRLIMILLQIVLLSSFLFAQKSTTHNPYDKTILDTFRLGSSQDTHPLILLNGRTFNIYSFKKNKSLKKKIKVLFVENGYTKVPKSNHTTDLSFCEKYFGQESNMGIVFIFTKNRVKRINFDGLKHYLKGNNNHILWKIDDYPLTDMNQFQKLQAKNIDKIYLIKGIPLKKWDTGKINYFDIIEIDTKNP